MQGGGHRRICNFYGNGYKSRFLYLSLYSVIVYRVLFLKGVIGICRRGYSVGIGSGRFGDGYVWWRALCTEVISRDIFGSIVHLTFGYSIRPHKDGAHYTMITPDRSRIIMCSYVTGKEVELYFDE